MRGLDRNKDELKIAISTSTRLVSKMPNKFFFLTKQPYFVTVPFQREEYFFFFRMVLNKYEQGKYIG